MLKKITSLIFFVLAISACETMDGSDENGPEITKNMNFNKAYKLAVKHGDVTISSFKDRVRANKEWKLLFKSSRKDLLENYNSMEISELQRVASLYHLTTSTISPEILKNLLRSNRAGARKVGLQMAGLRPSPEVAKVLENTLSLAIIENREKVFYTPELAHAVKANNVSSAYSFIKQGLLATGDDEFAKTLSSLSAERASYDFMDYISQATVEDLRQLNQTSINVYTCLVIFRFFLDNELPVAHPQIGKIFAFSISRNRALADMAVLLLENNISSYREEFVYALAKEPMRIQMAFIENAVRSPTSNIKLLLTDLRGVTAFSEVREEINSFRQL